MEKKQSKNKARRAIKRAALIMGTLLVAGGFLVGPSLAAGDENKGKTEGGETPVFSVKTEKAQKRTLRAYLELNGEILSGQETEVYPEAAGKLASVKAALGAWVQRGDLIAEVDPSKPGASYLNSPVYAPISGFVSRTPLPVGTTVNAGLSITTISAPSNLEISARVPEREIGGLKTGLKAEVSLPAYPGETFSATLIRVSPVLDSASRTKLITLSFDRNDSRINAGMFARLKINTRTYRDVLTVPAEALLHKRGETLLYIVGDMRDSAAEAAAEAGASALGGRPVAEARQVAAGLSLDGWTEIKSGLQEGEAVIVQGQRLLSGGEALRIVARGGK